jgi:hypothetical protein
LNIDGLGLCAREWCKAGHGDYGLQSGISDWWWWWWFGILWFDFGLPWVLVEDGYGSEDGYGLNWKGHDCMIGWMDGD